MIRRSVCGSSVRFDWEGGGERLINEDMNRFQAFALLLIYSAQYW